MPADLTRKEAQAQQVQQQTAAQGTRDVETQEHHAKASASVRVPKSFTYSSLHDHHHIDLITSHISPSPSFTPIKPATAHALHTRLSSHLHLTWAKPASPISPPLSTTYKGSLMYSPGRAEPQPLRRALRRPLKQEQEDHTHLRRRLVHQRRRQARPR